MRKVVFDIETSNIFEEVNSTDSTKLDIAVVCIYDYETDKYMSFTQETLKDLWPILEKTDILIGFNSDHFDIPLLDKYYTGDLTKIKSLDLLKEVRESLGRRIKLDTLAEATLGKKKSGHGLEASAWWKNGEKEKVIAYCIDDVKITREIYEYALREGKLKYKDNGEIKDIKMDTSKWNETLDLAMTHTLPF